MYYTTFPDALTHRYTILYHHTCIIIAVPSSPLGIPTLFSVCFSGFFLFGHYLILSRIWLCEYLPSAGTTGCTDIGSGGFLHIDFLL